MKKTVTTLLLLFFTMICSALTFTTITNQVIVGEITAKQAGSFYLETIGGTVELPMDNVRSIMDGDTDVTLRYFARRDYGTPRLSERELATLSTFEREVLRQMAMQTEISKKSSKNVIYASLVWSASYIAASVIIYNALK